jgi:hypothetical protein
MVATCGAAQAREYDDLVVLVATSARQAGSGKLEFKFHEKELKNPTRLIHLITIMSHTTSDLPIMLHVECINMLAFPMSV